jgi:hypothetical protein
VAKGGGAVSVGVAARELASVGVAVLVDVACARLMGGKLQPARSKATIATNMTIDGIIFRFTVSVEIIIPA